MGDKTVTVEGCVVGLVAAESGLTIREDTSTASKLDPATWSSSLRTSLFQRESGAPEMYQEEPLSARIMP